MASAFDNLCEIKSGREAWRIKVRVVRTWKVPSFMNPEQANSLEMIFVDEKGCRIHATVRKQLLYLFQDKIVEGEVYKMAYFGVVPNLGSYRSTVHDYKLVFQMKTKIQKAESSTIPLYGLSFTKCADLKNSREESVFLVDVIGLLTGMSDLREYVKDGKVVKMTIIEVTDDSGKIECALFGEYAESLKSLMESAGAGMPVVVMQFLKQKIFRDNSSLTNIMGTTRLMLNPDIPEVVSFKNGLAVHGVESSYPVAVLQARGKVSKEDDFLNLYPKRTIGDIKNSAEEGTFVVYGTVTDLVEGDEFWYPSCKCHKAVTPDSGSYYCSSCVKHVFQIVPRFRLKIRVCDGIDDAVFVMFDTDVQQLIGKTCAQVVAESKADCDLTYPAVFDALVGKEILLKVEKRAASSSSLFDISFRVKRACDDSSIIALFLAAGEVVLDSAAETAGVVGVKDVVDQGVEGSVPAQLVEELIVNPVKSRGATSVEPVKGADSSDSGDDTQEVDDSASAVAETPVDRSPAGGSVDGNPVDLGGGSVVVNSEEANVMGSKVCVSGPVNVGAHPNEVFADADPTDTVVDSFITPETDTVVSQTPVDADDPFKDISISLGDDDTVLGETEHQFVAVPAVKVNKPCAGKKRSKRRSVSSCSARKNLSDVFEELGELDVKRPLKVVKTEKP